MPLKVNNRALLSLNAITSTFIDELVSSISDYAVLSISRLTDRELLKAPGWLVMRAEDNQGWAFNSEVLNICSCTGLRGRINSLNNLKTIIANFGIQKVSRLKLSDSFDCPSEWISYRVEMTSGALLVGVSEGVLNGEYLPDLAEYREKTMRLWRARRTHIRLSGEIEWGDIINVGDIRTFSAISFRCLEQDVDGELFITEGGCLAMQKEELAGQIDDLGVRVAIEIGEVELSLGELAGLRAGSRVELSAELPLRCYLKVGVTTIAVGELEQVDDGLQILVREVIG